MAEIILAVVEDLLFLSKIRETARRVGVSVESVEAAATQERLSRSPVQAVIVDLNHRSGAALDLLRAIKADPSSSAVKTLGFVSHVQTDLAAAARAAGCDSVVARSTFSRQLPQLLAQLAAKDVEAPPRS